MAFILPILFHHRKDVMTQLSISKKISLGFSVLLALLLFVGMMAHLGINSFLKKTEDANRSITTTSVQLEDAVTGMSDLTHTMDILKKSGKDFENLTSLSEDLKQTRTTTQLISDQLSKVQSSVSDQTLQLLRLQESGQALQNEMNKSSAIYFEILRAVEDINTHILSAYIGFFNYLNEYSPSVEAPLAEIGEISDKLKLVSSHITNAEAIETSDGHPLQHTSESLETINKIKKLLRRFRYYMKDLGQTTSNTQISEIGQNLVRYGTEIMEQSTILRRLAWDLADQHNHNSKEGALVSEKIASEAVKGSEIASKIASESVDLALSASQEINLLAESLTSAIDKANIGLKRVPEALIQTTNSTQVIDNAAQSMKSVIDDASLTLVIGKEKQRLIDIMTGVSMLLGIIIASLLYFSIIPKLKRLGEWISGVEESSDLSKEMDVTGNDEVSQIAIALNNMLRSFKDIISSIENTVEQLTLSSRNQTNLANSASDNAHAQQDEGRQITSSMNEMIEMVQSISTSATEAKSKACVASKDAFGGNEMTSILIQEIGELQESGQLSMQALTDLLTSVEDISSILSTIRGIADQTNLLALNAAIEAARAGEQGRGFAVVADEVRGLATRTQHSVDEIGGMIESLEASSTNISQQMKLDVDQTHKAVLQAEQTGQVLKTIHQSAVTIAELNSQIADDTIVQDQHSKTIQNRLQIVESLYNQTSNNTDSARQAAFDLDKMVENLKTISRRFKC